MEMKEILNKVDHTLLTTTASWEDIRLILDDAMAYHTASACIPASYVKKAADYVSGKLAICTVIGFPNGYSTTATKVFECQDAIKNGAAEIDMVINLTDVKNGDYAAVEDEIRQIKAACGSLILKVIVETCQLTKEELIELCGVVTRSGADFIKTSTGFSTAGATFEDVALMAEHVGKDVQIKAAGGISSLEDAEKFISLGASRLGTSRIIKIVKHQKVEEGSY
ncbi:deoxyribose-phosphate aldolase [Streptococcus rifensis]